MKVEKNMRAKKTKPKGTWIQRCAIWFFSIVLTVLAYWMLGFLMKDIRSIRGPDYDPIEEKHLSKPLVERCSALGKQIADLSRQIENQTAKQKILGDSSRNLQQTITQLVELQKLGLQKNAVSSSTEQADFTTSLNLFLDNQKKYQELSQTISDMLENKQGLEREKELANLDVEKQRKPARDEYNALSEKHRLKLAVFQLLILLPILALAVVIALKKRSSIYFPLVLATGVATAFKVALVAHEYFPSKYSKYLLIGGLFLAVARLLVYFIRSVAFPKTEWLTKQYREAYERFLCPVCEFPIRLGPRRFLFWTRRTVNKIIIPNGGHGEHEEAYTCPSCGSALFEECPACHKIRHVMLPNCSHCGNEKC